MAETISFDKDDLEGIQVLHNDALIVLTRIANWRVRRVMVDTGASADILFNHCYEQIKHTIQTRLRSYDHDLYGFDGRPLKPRGIIKLPLELGDGGLRYVVREIEFVVVDVESPYNAILGWNSINAFELVISMAHLKAKFLTPEGVGECRGDQKLARELCLKALKEKQVCMVNAEPEERSTERGEPAERNRGGTARRGPRAHYPGKDLAPPRTQGPAGHVPARKPGCLRMVAIRHAWHQSGRDYP